MSLSRESAISAIQTSGARLWKRSKSSEPMWLFASANYNPINVTESFRFNLAFVLGSYQYNVKLNFFFLLFYVFII